MPMPKPTGELPESIAEPWHDTNVPPAYLETMRAIHSANELGRLRQVMWGKAWVAVKLTFYALVVVAAVHPFLAIYAMGIPLDIELKSLGSFALAWFLGAAVTIVPAFRKAIKTSLAAEKAQAFAKEQEEEAERKHRTVDLPPEQPKSPVVTGEPLEAAAEGAGQ